MMTKISNPEILRLVAEKTSIENQLLDAICSDESMTKLHRLYAIESYNLFDHAGFIKYPVRDKYLPELKQKALEQGAKFFRDDCWLFLDQPDSYSRSKGDTISIPSELSAYLWEKDADELVVVLRDRATQVEIKITREQLENDVYEWCLKNKTVSFSYDW